MVALRERQAFAALGRDGRRARSGPVSVTHHARADRDELHVAYAIGRPVGNAVTRNRLRRRLRAALTDLERERATPPTGDLLVAVRPEASSARYSALVDHLRVSFARLADGPPS